MVNSSWKGPWFQGHLGGGFKMLFYLHQGRADFSEQGVLIPRREVPSGQALLLSWMPEDQL